MLRSAVTLAVIFLTGCFIAPSTQFDRAKTESHAQVEGLVHDAAIASAAIAVTVGDRIVA